MITINDRIRSGSSFLTLTIVDQSGLLTLAMSELTSRQLADMSLSPFAAQVLGNQVASAQVIEEYTNNPQVGEELKGLMDGWADVEEEEEFSLDLSGVFDQEKDEDSLNNYDLAMRAIYVLNKIFENMRQKGLSPFTPEIYQGKNHFSLEGVKERLRHTIDHICDTWPQDVVNQVLEHCIYDYDSACAFLTNPIYLEYLKEKGKIEVGVDKRQVGSIPYGQFQKAPPFEMATGTGAEGMLAPVQGILLSLDSLVTTSGKIGDADRRKFVDMRDGIMKSIRKLDKFISDRKL